MMIIPLRFPQLFNIVFKLRTRFIKEETQIDEGQKRNSVDEKDQLCSKSNFDTMGQLP